MKAHKLKTRLKHLLLVGYKDKKLIWSGTDEQHRVVKQQDYLFELHAK